MFTNELEEERASLMRTNRVCAGISVVIKVVFAIICLFWLFVVVSMIASFVNTSNAGGNFASDVTPIVLHIMRGAVVAVLFVILNGIFSETAKGESPFTLKQVNRLRYMALALLVYAVLELIFSASTAMFQLGSLNSGYFSTNDSAIITFDFAPLIASAVIFAFSFVFQYGVLLQEFSDETL
ncbi:hypothetical protein [Gordonibacter massiliensis (ex Traore et al. 2017)]|uniref:hypothetical protein n=1 Tax=Gordonibacter massiliensis (ex Traore et al. 2017) TaxID=1841863 RepID=UPI001C8BCC4F|nr:hypothetical protein [Gordonibacter massiliensis (ex Traore et al. 2017)]MBX9033040.1 hypothetical protein [Gordonibacter massiliensis (ex Traore et al. 2017)]